MILSEKEETVEKAAEEARPEGLEQSPLFAFPFGLLVLAWNAGKGSNRSEAGGRAAGCEAQEVHSQAVRQVAPQGAESSWSWLSFVKIFVNCVQLREEMMDRMSNRLAEHFVYPFMMTLAKNTWYLILDRLGQPCRSAVTSELFHEGVQSTRRGAVW